MPRSGFVTQSRLLTPATNLGSLSEQSGEFSPSTKNDLPFTISNYVLWGGGPTSIGPGGAGALPLLDVTFTPLDWMDTHPDTGYYGFCIIAFDLGCTISTDAVPGNTTFRVRLGGLTIASQIRGETAGATNLDCVYNGKVFIEGGTGVLSNVTGWINRISHQALYAQTANANVGSTTANQINADQPQLFELDIGSSDAGTGIANMMWQVTMTFPDPERSTGIAGRVITIDG